MLREDLKHITVENLRETNQISVRTANCCFISGLHSLYEIISVFEKSQSFFKVKIRNAGQKTCLELDNLCKEIITKLDSKNKCYRSEEILKIIKCLSEKERKILLSFGSLILETDNILKQKISLYGQYSSDLIITEFYEKYYHFPMFWILEQSIKHDNNRNIGILLDSFYIFNNFKKLSLEEIGQKHGLTRERIRQIRKRGFLEIFKIDKISRVDHKNTNIGHDIIFSVESKTDWSYLLDVFQNHEIISSQSEDIFKLLKEEQSNFSGVLVLQIMSHIFKEKYTLFGGLCEARKDRFWDNSYLILKELTDIFDFNKIRTEIRNLLSENKTDFMLAIEDYIANTRCWIKYDFSKTDRLKNIVGEILLYEFHLYSEDTDGRIKISANKERKAIEVLYEILKQTGRPMHLDEIFEEFKIILPEHKYTEAAQLRPNLQKHEAISYRNRKSVYTLKEWNHIRTGTIRDAIIEFLSENDTPKTADNIMEYVLKYFPQTNIASVRTSMLNDTQKRFSLFKDNTYGLKMKEYPLVYELIEQEEFRKSFEQRLLDLERFVIENGHFPFISQKNNTESSLGRWWYRIINHKNRISESQLAEVNRIKIQYAEYDKEKTTYEWDINYNKLKLFMLENRRNPSSTDDENVLYEWLRRAMEDFKNYKLTKKQRQKYIDLAKLI